MQAIGRRSGEAEGTRAARGRVRGWWEGRIHDPPNRRPGFACGRDRGEDRESGPKRPVLDASAHPLLATLAAWAPRFGSGLSPVEHGQHRVGLRIGTHADAGPKRADAHSHWHWHRVGTSLVPIAPPHHQPGGGCGALQALACRGRCATLSSSVIPRAAAPPRLAAANHWPATRGAFDWAV